VHARTNDWRGVAAQPNPLFVAMGDDTPDARVDRALAPARGALVGMMLGAVCWSAVAAVVWMIL
jgi:hypothetical protein